MNIPTTNVSPPAMRDERLAPFGVLVRHAWETWQWLFKRVWFVAFFAWLFAVAFPALLDFRGASRVDAHPLLALLSVFSPFVGLVLSSAVLPVFALLLLRDRDTNETKNKDVFFQSLNLFVPLFVVNMLVGFATIGGLVLLLIPGILLSIRLSMALYAFVLEDRRGMNALLRSIGLVRGSTWGVFRTFFGFGLAAFFVMMLLISFAVPGSEMRNAPEFDPTGDGAFLIESLWAGVLMMLFTLLQLALGYAIFTDLSGKRADVVAQDRRRFVKVSVGIGITALVVVLVAMALVAGLLISSF